LISQAFFVGWPKFHNATPIGYGFAKRSKAMLRNFKVLLVVLVAIVLAASAYAFAASNTVNTPKAGEGFSLISGYTVDVAYNLNASDPTLLDSVDLTLNAAATDVKIKLVAASSTWIDCSGSGTAWTCNTTGQTISGIDRIDVVATDS
jgi:hypothetical protein